MRQIYKIDSIDGGLITNVDKGDLPPNSATKLQNMRGDQPGKARGIPGYKLFKSGPTAIAADLRHFQEVVIDGSQIMICWGLDGSGVQHFYYYDNNILVEDWIEITEYEVTTILTGSSPSSTVMELTAGNASDDYYNSPHTWILYHETTGGSENRFDLVKDYDASNGSGNAEITVLYGVDTPAAGDTIHLMRFPLWNASDLESGLSTAMRALVRDEDNFKPTIVQRQDAVAIYTGRKKDGITAGMPNHSNLWLGGVKILSMFSSADSALTYQLRNITGGGTRKNIIAERKFLDGLQDANIVSAITSPASAAGVGFDAGDYGVKTSLLYDGYQESPIFLEDGDTIASALVHTVASGDAIQITLSWDRLTTKTEMNLHPGSKRLTAIRIYLCTVDAENRPTSPFFLVNEVSVADSESTMSGFWSGTGPYTITITLEKPDWEAGKKKEAELVHGYFSNIRVDADFGATIDGREVVASIVAGEAENSLFGRIARTERTSFVISSAINLAKRNTQDCLPETDIRDMQEHGIYEIKSLMPLGTKAAIFGENNLVLLQHVRGVLEEVDNLREKGISGNWSAVSNGDVLYWGNQSSIYRMIDGGRPEDIGFPIKNEWQSLSETNRKKSIAVYSEEKKLFVLHSPSGTSYVYDEIQKSWHTYVADKSWEWLSIGVDGEILATDKTDIYELFPASGSTENVTSVYEKVIDFENIMSVKFLELMYKITGTITAKVFDLEIGESYPIATTKFFSKTNFDAVTKKMSFRAKKIKLQLTFAATTNPDWEWDWAKFFGEPVTENL